MKRKQLALLLAVFMLLATFASCSKNAKDDVQQSNLTTQKTQEDVNSNSESKSTTQDITKKIKVALSGNFLSHEFQQRMIKGMEYIAEEKGIDFMVADANGDIAKQIADIEGFISSGVDVLLFKPVDVNSLDDVIAECNKKGIPTISQGEVVKGQTAAAALNHTLDGNAMAEYTYEYFKDKNVPVKILSVNFPELPTIVELENGFFNKLDELGMEYEVVRVNGKGLREVSLQVSTDALTANPDINCVFGINDDSALGAYSAFEAAGINTDEVLFLTHGIEGNAAGKAIMEDGVNLAGFAMFPEYYAINFFTTGLRALEGEEVEDFAWYYSFMVDKDNYSEYYQKIDGEYTANLDIVVPLLEQITKEYKERYPNYVPPT